MHLSSKMALDRSSLPSWFLRLQRICFQRHQQVSDVTEISCEGTPHYAACLL